MLKSAGNSTDKGKMKPYYHAVSSSKKYGGKPEDYLDIHNWFDESKSWFPDNRHRVFRHHSQGIFECEKVFGVVRKNSDGRIYNVRDIGEQHIAEDFGHKFIPTVADYLQEIEFKEWMNNGHGEPPSSHAKVAQREAKRVANAKVTKIPFIREPKDKKINDLPTEGAQIPPDDGNISNEPQTAFKPFVTGDIEAINKAMEKNDPMSDSVVLDGASKFYYEHKKDYLID